MKENILKPVTTIGMSIFMVVFTFCIFAPMELYLSNKDYFFFGGEDILPYAIGFCIVAWLGVMLIFILAGKVNRKFSNVLITLLWSIGIALYIQGNFILVDYGALDGDEIDWSEFKTEGIISVLVFCIIIVLTLISYKIVGAVKFQKVTEIISICVVLIQIVTIATLLISKNGLSKPMEYVSTSEKETELSENDNFIILMLDSYDSQVFGKILEDDNEGKYKDILEDFTYYPDTIGNFSWTALAFPALLSGDYYRNECDYGVYLNRAYENSPFLNELKDKKWYDGIYTTSLLPQDKSAEKMDNCREVTRTVSSHKRLMEYMYRLVGFRYLPQPLKKYCWFYADDIRTSLECAKGDGIELYGSDNFVFYDTIDQFQMNQKENMFHLYHLDGTHPPFTITPDFTVVDSKTLNYDEDGIYDEARGMIVLVNKFLNQLKQIDAYDNSTIMILADHGYFGLRHTPLLLVKGKEDKHPFKQLKTQISYDDMQEAFHNILSGAKTAETILNIPEDEQRKRIYTFYQWYIGMEADSHAREITEYEINGNSWNPNNIKKTGKVYIYIGNNAKKED